jgi:hypothetical protein
MWKKKQPVNVVIYNCFQNIIRGSAPYKGPFFYTKLCNGMKYICNKDAIGFLQRKYTSQGLLLEKEP